MLADRVRIGRQMGDKFGAPILTEPGIFLDMWSAFGTGTGVAQVYDDMLYLSGSPDAIVGDAAQFLSDPVKVSSDTLGWLMTIRQNLGGNLVSTLTRTNYSHGIPIGTIVKIAITFTCTGLAIPQMYIPAKFELEIEIMDEYGGLLAGHQIGSMIEGLAVSIDLLKFT